MLDIGWQELLVIGAIALIVVGPKDLPGMLRTLGQYVGKLRGMAKDFQRTMDQAARDADLAELKELRELKKDMASATNFNFKEQAAATQNSLTNPKPADALAEFEKVKKTPEPEIEAPAEPSIETKPAPIDPPVDAVVEPVIEAPAKPAPEKADLASKA